MSYEMLRDIIRVRRNSFIFLAFLAVLNLALLFYLSSRQQPELARAQTEWFALRDAMAKGESVGNAARLEKGTRDLALFEERFIAKREFPAFLSELFQKAKSNSLAIKSISYKPAEVKGQPLLTYGISFSVSGRYGSLKSFLADLARYREMVTLDAVTLTSTSQTEESVELRVQMTAYLKKEGA